MDCIALSIPFVFRQNDGFLRDDALLFVVAVTNEDEEMRDSQGNPLTANTIVNRYINAKSDLRNVVFLGIGGDSNCGFGPYGVVSEEAIQLRNITQSFSGMNRGLFWDLCQGDLETAFDQAVSILDDACREGVF